jgi:hypothetical protein
MSSTLPTVETMPASACPLGYPREQLETWLGSQAYRRLCLWMLGQTLAICEGRRYDSESGEYQPDGCAEHPHGPVVYRWDVARWLQAGPIID